MQLLDGKKISEQIKTEIASEVAKMKANGEKVPSPGSNYRWK